MIRAILSRDDLGSYLSRPNLKSLDMTLASAPKKNQVVLEFSDNNLLISGMPRKIIVPDEELEQFFAWTATYFDALSPITSFIDVVPASEDFPASKIVLPEERIKVLVTIAVVEAAVQIRRSKARQGPGMFAASLRCVSWVYAQCLARGKSQRDLATTLERWLRVRSTLTGVDTPFRFEYITAFWNEMLPLFGVRGNTKAHGDLMRINTVVLERGYVDLEYWSSASAALRSSSQVENILRGPRQERVELFDEAARSLPNGDENLELYAAYCGYLGSRVSDGGLELWNVVSERSNRFPTMPLWFAFYCGARNNTDLMAFERAVPWRLTRELETTRFDIDAREFMVLSRGKGINTSDLHVASPGSISARLAPDITASFLVREPVAHSQPDERPQPSRQSKNDHNVRAAISEARILSEKMTAALARVQQALDAINSPQQDLGLQGIGPESSTQKSGSGTKKRGKN